MSATFRWPIHLLLAAGLAACSGDGVLGPDVVGTWSIEYLTTARGADGEAVTCETWTYALTLREAGTYTAETTETWRDDAECPEPPGELRTREEGSWDVFQLGGGYVLVTAADEVETDAGDTALTSESERDVATGTDARGRFLALETIGVMREVR